ncbi:MAG: division/cell wall cluster transcriptional repressor MraZ [Anaerolineales bacterium]|nr:division/cell wall cluster transcriptional repressor MraZ [Anaerolineales bacterium]MCX7609609.1 division/cell wall cluster transcriptional repressor MraZ [Anaerolineales bacterium]MDW8227850.1 division/cell wall cluster transcriptional repressor MraZ [Anaerolineales bacterium]
MFLNQYRHSFDDKGRLTIPAKFRVLPDEGAYVIQGLDRNLMVLPPDVFRVIYDRLMAMSLTDPSARLLRRIILGNAQQVIPDSAGRILLSQNLRDYANLHDEVVFVGQGDYFEIWNPDLWAEQETLLGDATTNAQRFATLDLKTR